jgi:hypothetical protein
MKLPRRLKAVMYPQHITATVARDLNTSLGKEPGMVKRSARIVLGMFLVVTGIIVTPLPIPFGLLMIVIGLSLLASDIPVVHRALVNLRHRYQAFSARLNDIKHHLPGFARKLIEDTDPGKP